MLKLHSLKPAKGSKKTSRRVGRGQGSGRGKTAGRGTKGQKARTGGRNKLRLKGMKFITLRLPKLGGFTSRHSKAETVSLREIIKAMPNGGAINRVALAASGLVSSASTKIKIVGGGDIKQKFTLKGCKISSGAKEAIVKAGGSVA